MSDDKKCIAELKKQLMDLRKSAVSMMVGMSEAIAPTPGARAELARMFEETAQQEGPSETQRLARILAEALRAK